MHLLFQMARYVQTSLKSNRIKCEVILINFIQPSNSSVNNKKNKRHTDILFWHAVLHVEHKCQVQLSNSSPGAAKMSLSGSRTPQQHVFSQCYTQVTTHYPSMQLYCTCQSFLAKH